MNRKPAKRKDAVKAEKQSGNKSDRKSIAESAVKAVRTYGGVDLDRRQNERRRSFVEAGLEVIGTHGYRHATLRTICTAAGLTERYYYESFAGREALLCAVYTHVLGELRTRIVTALQALPPDPEALSRTALDVFFATVREDPRAARILFSEILGVSPQVDKLYRRGMRDFSQLIGGLVRQSLGARAVAGVDLDVLAGGLVGTAVQIATDWALSGYQRPQSVVVENCHLVFISLARELERRAADSAQAAPRKRSR